MDFYINYIEKTTTINYYIEKTNRNSPPLSYFVLKMWI